jgi:putative transposase
MRADLNKLIHSNPDSRELKRAVAVQMYLQGQRHQQIQEVLGVSSGFISKWTRRYELLGASGLRLGYPGSVGYLSTEERQSVVGWLKTKNYWNLIELQTYLETEYEVVFESKQSYYDLFAEAGISWKKTQKQNPKKDPEAVKKKDTRSATG